MGIQVISRDGQPEYAVVPWAQYQALLAAAGGVATLPIAPEPPVVAAPTDTQSPAFRQLAQLREAKGLKVAVLAQAVGISPAYLAMIESGEREPDAAIKRSLAWELGVPSWREAS